MTAPLTGTQATVYEAVRAGRRQVREIMAATGLGEWPVRTALTRLRGKGLVTRESGVGYVAGNQPRPVLELERCWRGVSA